MQQFPEEIRDLLIAEDEIQRRVSELADCLNSDYQGKQLVIVGILRGAALFHADLIRKVNLSVKIDFLSVSSYGSEKDSSGKVHLLKDLELDITGEHVLLVEDIVDSGLTLEFLLETLSRRNPASLRVCTLLSKPSRRERDVRVDYVGFEVPNEFVVGYGLDFDHRFRNLPYIGILKESVVARNS